MSTQITVEKHTSRLVPDLLGTLRVSGAPRARERTAPARVHAETRRSAEIICQRAYLSEGIEGLPAERLTLDALIDRLDEQGALPSAALRALRAIQRRAATRVQRSGEDVLRGDANPLEAAQQDLCAVVTWYFERYTEEKAQPSPSAIAIETGLELVETSQRPGNNGSTASPANPRERPEQRLEEPRSTRGANLLALIAGAVAILLMLASWWTSPVIPS